MTSCHSQLLSWAFVRLVDPPLDAHVGLVPPHVEHLYVHVPFCTRRCSYCDFAIAVRRAVPAHEFAQRVRAEFEARRADVRFSPMRTVYFGGGTPSKLGSVGVDAVLSGLKGAGLILRSDAEVTLECNPEDMSPVHLTEWRRTGISRLSVGIQSFDDRALDWMHRSHSADAAVQAVRDARAAGFADISVDLIFGLPEQLDRDWERDLDRAVELGVDHLSVYGLTAEPASPFGRWLARGEVVAAPDERYATEFLLAHERLTGSGYEHYEVSNYARPGCRSRHNSSYWSRVPYLGLGPSAHSFDGARTRWWNTREYEAWRTALAEGRDVKGGSETLAEASIEAERVYLGLRTTSGLSLEPMLDDQWSTYVQAGWASINDGRGTLTPQGWLRLDSIAASLTAAGSR